MLAARCSLICARFDSFYRSSLTASGCCTLCTNKDIIIIIIIIIGRRAVMSLWSPCTRAITENRNNWIAEVSTTIEYGDFIMIYYCSLQTVLRCYRVT